MKNNLTKLIDEVISEMLNESYPYSNPINDLKSATQSFSDFMYAMEKKYGVKDKKLERYSIQLEKLLKYITKYIENEYPDEEILK